MLKLIIKRSKWLRGETEEDSQLLSPNTGKMCCLGFLARQCGYTAKDIKGILTPEDVANTSKFIPRLIKVNEGVFNNTKLCNTFMDINDASEITDYQREKRLIKWFKHLKVDASFVD